MKRNEAIDVLEEIGDIYSKFELSETKATILLEKLLPMDYNLVKRNLSDHAAAKPYPPTIAEIAAYPAEENHHLQLIEKWRAEAAMVPDSLKEEFQREMIKLIKEKHDDND